MDIEIRPHTPDELWDYRTAVARGFGYDPMEQPGERELYLQRHQAERTFVALDDGQIVGTSIAHGFEMPLPGGQLAPIGGLTDVTVATTHRRRGILTQMMRKQLDAAHERGEAFSALWASESGIYSRFGFGMAMHHERWSIPTANGEFGDHPKFDGELRFAGTTEMRVIAPGVYSRVLRSRPGMLERPEAWWNLRLADPEHRRNGMSSFYFVVYEEKGEPKGYAQYRIKNQWTNKQPDKGLFLEELIAETDAAHAALWRFCLDVDMVTSIQTEHQPVDDCLWWMLANPRWLRRMPFDAVWLAILDPIQALSRRTYAIKHKLVLRVKDEFCPWVDGTYELDASEDGVEVKRTTETPDLTLWSSGLSACFLGGAPFSRLQRAGRVEARSQEALRKADLMFGTERAPYCPLLF
ncbi:MAG: GNAT family N-acetyltransferase [Bryobacterales bacterium]